MLSRALALRSPHTRTSSRPSQVSPHERTRQKPRRQVSKAVSESAADYADRSISRSNESTDILIIFYRLVTTRLWQPSNGTGGRPSGREDNRRGKGRGASDRIRDIQREREVESYIYDGSSRNSNWFCGERIIETIGRY